MKFNCWSLIFLFFILMSSKLLAQPANDECVGAIEISSAFEGACGDINTIGPFNNTGASSSNTDPMVPDCFKDTPPYGNSTSMEKSIWFIFTVPDVFGNGDDVRFDITTSVNSTCDLENSMASIFSDTQIVVYNAIFGCPNQVISSSTYIACNDDITTEPPYIAGVEVSLMVGETYYIVVDSSNGIETEFCFDIAVCGAECGDNICSANESYCICNQDCVCSALTPQFACAFQDDLIAFCGTNPTGDFIFCSSYFNDAPVNNVYMGFAVTSNGDCENNSYEKTTIVYNSAKLFDADYNLIPSGTEVPLSTPYFFELTPEDINNNIEIYVASTTALKNGKSCSVPFEIKTEEIFDVNSISCGSCVAGNVNQDLNNQVVYEGEMIEVCTDGTENLNISCDSTDDDGFEYRWMVYADLDNNGDFETLVTEPLEKEACDLLPVTFLRDWFNYFPGADFEILPPADYKICGLALCDNADGSTASDCETDNCIIITLAGEDIMGCTDNTACNYNEMATEEDGSCIKPGDSCNDNNLETTNDLILEDCTCMGSPVIVAIPGCTEPCFEEYNIDATEDDNSCQTSLAGCTDVNASNYNPDITPDCAQISLCTYTDSDGDSLPDYREDLNGNTDLEDDDTDEDGIPNFMDDDDDGDNILTIDEDNNNNGNLFDDDEDSDGIPDFLDGMMVGISEISLNFNISTNPNYGIFTIDKIPGLRKNAIKIYNGSGQAVNFNYDGRQIEILNPVNGMYFVTLRSLRTSFKVLVQNK